MREHRSRQQTNIGSRWQSIADAIDAEDAQRGMTDTACTAGAVDPTADAVNPTPYAVWRDRRSPWMWI